MAFCSHLLYLNGDGKIEISTTLFGQPDQQCFHLVFDLKMSSFGKRTTDMDRFDINIDTM